MNYSTALSTSSISLDTSRDGDSPRDEEIWDWGWRRAERCRSILGAQSSVPAVYLHFAQALSGGQMVLSQPFPSSSCSCACLSLLFILIFSKHLLPCQQEGEEPLNSPAQGHEPLHSTWSSIPPPGARFGAIPSILGVQSAGNAEPCVPAGTSLPNPPIAHYIPGACNELFNELSARLSR